MEEELRNPLVFQCRKCQVIVGDSYCLQASNEELQAITLTAASNIRRAHDVYTSKHGVDVGSTYFSFTCSKCDSPLGKYYLTTSKDLDSLRERFTFDTANIQSYELGKAEHGKMPEPEPDTSENKEQVMVSGASTETLAEDVLKVQHVLLDLGERVSAIESRMMYSMDGSLKRKKSRRL